jgi:hypothetical protein
MSDARPRSWAVKVVDMATLVLPSGSVRRRYRQELASELWGMTTGQQLRHASSILVSAPALHRALLESGELDVPHSLLWCRLHLHHRWHNESTDDGARYRRCLACGTDESASVNGGTGEGIALGNAAHWY